MDEVKRVFSPEFINRLSDIIVFHPLNEKEMTDILVMMLAKVRAKIEAQGYKIEFSVETDKFLIKNGFDVNYGARPLGRTIQRSVEDPFIRGHPTQEIRARRHHLRRGRHGQRQAGVLQEPGRQGSIEQAGAFATGEGAGPLLS